MSQVIMVVYGPMGREPMNPPQVLVDCDFEAGPPPGGFAFVEVYGDITRINCSNGMVTMSSDRAKAKRFESAKAALEFWKRQSVTRPTRPDGRPNRPMTAYSVQVEAVA